jgi:hypothetical protein
MGPPNDIDQTVLNDIKHHLSALVNTFVHKALNTPSTPTPKALYPQDPFLFVPCTRVYLIRILVIGQIDLVSLSLVQLHDHLDLLFFVWTLGYNLV